MGLCSQAVHLHKWLFLCSFPNPIRWNRRARGAAVRGIPLPQGKVLSSLTPGQQALLWRRLWVFANGYLPLPLPEPRGVVSWPFRFQGGLLQTQFTDGSKKSHWFSVWPAFSYFRMWVMTLKALSMLGWNLVLPWLWFSLWLYYRLNHVHYLMVYSFFCLSSPLEHKLWGAGTWSVCSLWFPNPEECLAVMPNPASVPWGLIKSRRGSFGLSRKE